MTRRGPANPVERCTGFDWDEGNAAKNWVRHRVTPEEAEGIFFHDPMLLRTDDAYSGSERRFRAMGETRAGRRLLVVFAIRKNLIRVISARDLSRKENEAYRRYEKENS
jgi:uncharacterized DUF497 family protein